MTRTLIGVALYCAMLGACTTVPETVPDAGPAEVPIAAMIGDVGMEGTFVPSLAARPGRPCGDIVGLSMSGPFTAAVVQLGEARDLTDATPEMIACVQQNNLDVETTDGF